MSPLPGLGEYLRSEREKRGISIEQIASATKISLRLLHSLEQDQYADLPAKPFVRGFIVAYSRFVGLNPHDVLTRFRNYLDERCQERPTHEEGHVGYAFERKEGEKSRAMLWAVMGSFVVLGAIAIFVFKPSLRHRKSKHLQEMVMKGEQPQATPSGDVMVAESGAVASPSVAPTHSATPEAAPTIANTPVSPTPVALASPVPSPTASSDTNPEIKPDLLNKGDDLAPDAVKHRMLLKAEADAWIRYQVDNKPSYMFLLRKGRMIVLKGTQGVALIAPVGDAIQIKGKGGAFKPIADAADAKQDGDFVVLSYSKEPTDKIKEFVKQRRPFPAVPPPKEP